MLSNTYAQSLSFDRCNFVAHDIELLFLENNNLGSCAYMPMFGTCTFRRDSSNPARTSSTVLRGVLFNGTTSLDVTPTAAPGPGTHFLQDVVFNGESGSGFASLAGNGDIYQVPCPGLVIGGNATDNMTVTVTAGQLLIENNSHLIVRSGAMLELGQGSDFMIQGKVTVEPGATLIIHPTARINPYNDSRIGELNIQPGAILGGRTDFSGTIDGPNSGLKVCVTGNHPQVTSFSCAGSPSELRVATAPADADAKPAVAALTAYPVPFTDVLTVELPQQSGDVDVRVIDSFGRVVLSQHVAAGKASVQLGQSLASGHYLVQVVGIGRVSQTKVVRQ